MKPTRTQAGIANSEHPAPFPDETPVRCTTCQWKGALGDLKEVEPGKSGTSLSCPDCGAIHGIIEQQAAA